MKKGTLLILLFTLIVFLKPQGGMAADKLDHLQAQIDSMKEGAVLKLENRTYEGNIVINKSMTIIGAKDTVIKGDGTGNVIEIRAPHVTLSHLTVTGGSMSRNSAEEYAAIKLYTDHNIVEYTKIRRSFHGIYLSKAFHNIIRNNTIKGVGKGEIAGQGNGIQVFYAENNLLEHNTIEGTRDGMYFIYGDKNKSYDNKISNTRYGLHYMYSNDNIFKRNTFTMNTGGAAVMNSNNLKLENNQFIFNYGNQSFGLLLLQANDNLIKNNTFYRNSRGLYIDQTTRNMFRDNKITQNQIGVEIWSSSDHQTFTYNQITDNTIPAVTLGGKGEAISWKKNDWGSAFPLTDLNQDQIGDFPITYRSSLHQLLSDQELTSLFLKSPSLPIFEKINALSNGEQVMFEDRTPLVTSAKSHYMVVIFAGILVLAIFLKGRKWLCTSFGRNGRKI